MDADGISLVKFTEDLTSKTFRTLPFLGLFLADGQNRKTMLKLQYLRLTFLNTSLG